ncbi:MAG: rRNA pseudouridine synthase [Bdellovibrionaceae bacterium]|nr:rRNA pseudouridine synthase [Pseudobdellovibrionaceae bacterium]
MHLESNNDTLRLSKLMSERGLCSRREADDLIAKGQVYVNGVRIAELGTKVTRDVRISLESEAMAAQKKIITVVLNKPVGYVSNLPERSYKQALELITADRFHGSIEKELPRDFWRQIEMAPKNLSVVGRLDIESQGLLILTHDGRLVKSIIGENSEIEKEYIVRVRGDLSARGLELLNHGLAIDNEPLKEAQVEWLNEDQLKFVLREGKKRQIRKMCEMVGLEVLGLKRVRIGNLPLGSLPEGRWRLMTDSEKKLFLK